MSAADNGQHQQVRDTGDDPDPAGVVPVNWEMQQPELADAIKTSQGVLAPRVCNAISQPRIMQLLRDLVHIQYASNSMLMACC